MANQEHGYTSSDHPVKSLPYEAILELGKRLTKELGIDQSVDTLGRWMAHYIAELIEAVENATGEDRRTKQQACCDAILNLWRHRYTLQYGKYPFTDLEPVLRALNSLDPDNDTLRYLRRIRESVKVEGENDNDNIKRWIELADELDYSAKILISHCLFQAAHNAIDRSAEWVRLAEDAEANNGVEFTVLDFLDFTSEPGDIDRKLIQNRIDRLEKFAQIAKSFVTDWQSSIYK